MGKGDHHVEIRDGGDENGRLIGNYFGDESPGTRAIISTGNKLYIKMNTSIALDTKGFVAHYHKGKAYSIQESCALLFMVFHCWISATSNLKCVVNVPLIHLGG